MEEYGTDRAYQIEQFMVEFSAIRFEIYARRYLNLKDCSIVSFRVVDRERSLTSDWSDWIPTADFNEKTPLYRYALAGCFQEMGYLPEGRGECAPTRSQRREPSTSSVNGIWAAPVSPAFSHKRERRNCLNRYSPEVITLSAFGPGSGPLDIQSDEVAIACFDPTGATGPASSPEDQAH